MQHAMQGNTPTLGKVVVDYGVQQGNIVQEMILQLLVYLQLQGNIPQKVSRMYLQPDNGEVSLRPLVLTRCLLLQNLVISISQ